MKHEHQHVTDDEIQLHLDGLGDPAWREEIEARLMTCAACARRVEAWRAMFTALDALPQEAMAQALRDDVLTQLAARKEEAHHVYRVLVGQALLVVALTVYMWLNRSILLLSSARLAAQLTAALADLEVRARAFTVPSLLDRITLPDFAYVVEALQLEPFASLSTWITVAILAGAMLIVINRRLLDLPGAERS